MAEEHLTGQVRRLSVAHYPHVSVPHALVAAICHQLAESLDARPPANLGSWQRRHVSAFSVGSQSLRAEV